MLIIYHQHKSIKANPLLNKMCAPNHTRTPELYKVAEEKKEMKCHTQPTDQERHQQLQQKELCDY